MDKKNGNGQHGGNLIVDLHAEIADLRKSLDRQQGEVRDGFSQVDNRFARVQEAIIQLQTGLTQLQTGFVVLKDIFLRHHQETDQHFGRVARMLMAVGDRLNDHERRLAAVETKLS